MNEHDTLPPEPEPMAPLTEERFRKILGEVVGSKLLEIHEDLRRCLAGIEQHSVEIAELRRLIRDLERRVDILELRRGSTSG